jgi:hypothetical protein
MDVAHHKQHVEVEIRSLVPAVSESTDAARISEQRFICERDFTLAA